MYLVSACNEEPFLCTIQFDLGEFSKFKRVFRMEYFSIICVSPRWNSIFAVHCCAFRLYITDKLCMITCWCVFASISILALTIFYWKWMSFFHECKNESIWLHNRNFSLRLYKCYFYAVGEYLFWLIHYWLLCKEHVREEENSFGKGFHLQLVHIHWHTRYVLMYIIGCFLKHAKFTLKVLRPQTVLGYF